MATCGARTKTCRNCGHRYSKAEYELWECPECGEPRACRRPVSAEGQRCRVHGGASPAGIASPHFKHGRRGKYLPTRLLERYEEAVGDSELLALRDEIALIDVRINELLERIDTGESAALWAQLGAKFEKMQQAYASQDDSGFARAVKGLGAIIEQGGRADQVWDDIGNVIEQRRKLVESERKRLVDMQQMLTAEQAMTLLAAVVDVVRRNVTDRDALAAISADVKRIVLAGPGRGVDIVT
jgi:predicted  nucleic acid-binding Zn-ribbon protein